MEQNMFSTASMEELQLQNPAEYILYMWKIQELARAFATEEEFCSYCNEASKESSALPFIALLKEVRSDLIREGNLSNRGRHTNQLQKLIDELEEEHQRLNKNEKEEVYEGIYIQVLPSILTLKEKNGGHTMGEIETCLVAIYGYHTLISQQQQVYPETLEMLKKISLLLKVLGEKRMDRLKEK